MAANKYKKYFITNVNEASPKNEAKVKSLAKAGAGIPTFEMDNVTQAFPETNVTGGSGVYFFKPHVMVKETHVHNFDEYLFFLGTDGFDAEIELHMGEEDEIHLITSPTIVYIPKNLVHCPLKFQKINRPVFFLHIRTNCFKQQ